MAEVIQFADGNYRFVKGVYPYSAGVAAAPGFALERARFRKPLSVAEGFRAIAAHLAARGRPRTAFAACELRSPAPFTEEGFVAFNRIYVGTLTEWQIFRDGCPGGESPAQIGARADRVVSTLRAAPGDVVVFAHGHILRVLAARWLELPPGDARHFLLGTAALCVLGYEHNKLDEPAVALWNDTSHVRP